MRELRIERDLPRPGLPLMRYPEGETRLPFPVNSGRASASFLIKRGAGTVLQIIALNKNAAARFLQLFDAVDLPAEGAIPNAGVFDLQPSIARPISWLNFGRRFESGLYAVLSTTAETKTIAAADLMLDALID